MKENSDFVNASYNLSDHALRFTFSPISFLLVIRSAVHNHSVHVPGGMRVFCFG